MKIQTNFCKIFKTTILAVLSNLILSCSNDLKREFIYSADNKNVLTILKEGNKTYLIPLKYNSDSVPSENYIINEHNILEYSPLLVKWKEPKTIIYSEYGEYDTTKADTNFIHKRITTKEFEELKKDSTEYKSFFE